MTKIIKGMYKEKVKYALIAVALVATAVFFVLPMLPQVESSFDTVGLKAGIIAAFAGDGASDGGGVGDGGGCCASDPAPSDPAPTDPGSTDTTYVPPPPPPPPEPIPGVPNPTYTCSADGTQVTFNFGVSGATFYNVRIDDNYALPELDYRDNHTSTSWTKNIIPGAKYHFWAHAGNSSGVSDAGNTSEFDCPAPTPKPPVPNPTYVCSANGTQVTFNYGVSGATKYNIRLDDANTSLPHIDVIDDYAPSSWTKYGITPGVTYNFWAHAGNSAGFSDAGHTGAFNCPAPYVPPSAPTCTLSASPNNLPYGGGSTQLSWTTDNATSVSINQGVGAVALDGSQSASVTSAKTFTLTATGAGGTVTCSASVTIAAPSAPTCNLSLNKTSIQQGESVTATWSSENGVSATLNGSSAALSGNQTFSPSQNTTYTFVVTGQNYQSVTCTKYVTVTPIPNAPTCTLSASPNNLPYGGGSTQLSWTTDNATSVSINQNVGTVALDGSQNVNVTSAKTFTLTATGAGGTVTCSAPVTIAQPSAPSCDLSLNKTSIQEGESVTATWSSQNGVSATLNGSSVSLSGNQTFSPTQNTTYTFVVTGQNYQSVTCTKYVTVTPKPAPTCTLSANPNNLPYGGGNTVLTWTTDNATSVSINQNVGSVALDGSKSVGVTSPKTFTLTATGPGGSVNCYATVTIDAPSAPTCTLSANPNNLPYGGGNVQLSWTTDNATSVSIDQSVGTVSLDGNRSVSVTTGKTFTLTATGPGGSVQCQAVVNIGQAEPPTCTLTASPNSFPYGGGNTVLTWTTDNATSVSINQGVGTVALDGSRNIAITAGKTYTLIATGPGGSIQCEAPIIVENPGLPTCDLAADPNSFPYGGGTTVLAWTTDNATSVSINQNVGTVALDGSKNVAVTSSKTFTLTATGPGGSVQCQAVVNVGQAQPPTCDLAVDPSTVNAGENARVDWSSTNVTHVVIKKVVGGNETAFQDTNAGQGSVIVSPSQTTTYKGTFTGPGGGVQCEDTITVITPQPTCTLTASPNSFPHGGGNTVLTWTTTGVDSAVIDQGVGTVALNGSRSVFVGNSKTFTLTVSQNNTSGAHEYSYGYGDHDDEHEDDEHYDNEHNDENTTVTCQATVTVAEQVLPACTLAASPNNHPFGGGSSVLSWTTTNADTVAVDQGVGTVTKNGSQSIGVTTTKTFTLTATNEAGSVTCTAPVTVGAPSQPTCTLSVDPSVVDEGGNARVDWSSTNVTHVVIKKIVGGNETTFQDTNAGTGSVIVSPSASTTYKGTFTGPGGSIQCEDSVTVRVPESTLSCDSFSINPSSVRSGGTATMTWNTTNADGVSIDQGVGTVALDGSKDVTVTSDRTYTLTATRGSQSVTCTASVNEESGGGGGGSPSPRCDAFKASDKNVRSGESVTLSWETTRGDRLEIEPNIFDTRDDNEVDDGEIVVKPKKDTRYTLTVWKGSKKDTCSVNVDVSGSNITVISDRDQQPLTSISFTQIPYTGFDAGPFLTGLFYTLLALWSLGIAYVLVIKRGAVLGFSLPLAQSGNHSTASVIPHKEFESRAHVSTTHAHEAAQHVPASVIFSAPAVKAIHEAPANLPTAMPAFMAAPVAQVAVAAPVSDEVESHELFAHLENVAHSHNILLSSDAIRLIIGQGGSEEKSVELLGELVARAKAAYPREDGWIVLNRERVSALFAHANEVEKVQAQVEVKHEETGARSLAEALVTGNTALAYELLNENPIVAIADAAEALDAVLRARRGGATAPDMLMRAAAHVSDLGLQNAVAALVSAIDGTYADETAAVRLSVIKALKALA